MAIKIQLKNESGIVKDGYIGFSWTCFFFGPFVPLIRGDVAWFAVCLVLSFAMGLGNLVFAFIYNKMYTKNLIERGYKIVGTDEQIAIYKQKLGMI